MRLERREIACRRTRLALNRATGRCRPSKSRTTLTDSGAATRYFAPSDIVEIIVSGVASAENGRHRLSPGYVGQPASSASTIVIAFGMLQRRRLASARPATLNRPRAAASLMIELARPAMRSKEGYRTPVHAITNAVAPAPPPWRSRHRHSGDSYVVNCRLAMKASGAQLRRTIGDMMSAETSHAALAARHVTVNPPRNGAARIQTVICREAGCNDVVLAARRRYLAEFLS